MADKTAGRLLTENPLAKSKYHRVYWDIAKRDDLTPGAKLAHALLISYATMYDEVYPGMETMATDLAVSRHSVMRYMKELEGIGLLRVDRPKGGRTNTYMLMDWTKKQSSKVLRRDLLRSSVERSNVRLSPARVEPTMSQPATHLTKEGGKRSSPKKKNQEETPRQFEDRRRQELGWGRYLSGDQARQLEREYHERDL